MRSNIFCLIASTAGLIFSFLFGEVGTVFYVLLAMVCIDFITGLLKGWYTKELDSRICSKGIIKKVFIFLIVALCHLVDISLGTSAAMNVTMFYFIASEGLSILENAAKCGVVVPEGVKSALAQLKDNSEKGESR